MTSNRTAVRFLSTALVAVTAFLTLGAAPASADVALANRTFHTEVQCGGSFMTVSTDTQADDGGYVYLYVYSYNTGTWSTDNQWHAANAWSGFFTPNVRTSYGYYYVYAVYASWNGSSWSQSGEYVRSYLQQGAYASTRSAYCLMGT
jgi:hypothetical protein